LIVTGAAVCVAGLCALGSEARPPVVIFSHVPTTRWHGAIPIDSWPPPGSVLARR
jgi:hypothetical protein